MSDPSASVGKRKTLDDKKLSKGKRELGSVPGQVSPRDVTKQNLEGEDDEDDEMNSDDLDHLEFEDPFGDEFEEEDFDAEEYESDGDDEEEEDNDGMITDDAGIQKKVSRKKRAEEPMEEELEEEEEGAADGELEYDPSAYVMYHSVQMEWPCLSFDFIRDEYGDNRQRVRINTSFSY